MAFGADQTVLLDRLDSELRIAPGVARGMLAKIVGSACSRIPVLGCEKVSRIDRLIEAGAWTDAALALIELELPAWKVRRLLYENGEWFCSLSRHPGLPAAFDESADANHEILPLAVLRAFIEAQRRSVMPSEFATTVPRFRPMTEAVLCCDNFA
jgi:hypothetical protein